MKDKTLPATIVGFQMKISKINGVRLHYWLGGDPEGQPVMLWHGFLSTGYAWREVAPALAEAGFAVLVPDMRGYGDSDKPEGKEGYDARALAEEGRALAQEIDFGKGKPIIHAAHDMGALPALIWTADHPGEVAALLYIEAPVVVGEVMNKLISFTPEALKEGSLWWWMIPFAPDVPERLIVGNERAFLTWFFDRHTVNRQAIGDDSIQEYLRTFTGREGVLGSLGVYRAMFQSMEQTEPLMRSRLNVPVIAMGGVKGLGATVGKFVRLIANNVKDVLLHDSGHFVPEERPDAVVNEIVEIAEHRLGFAARAEKSSTGKLRKVS